VALTFHGEKLKITFVSYQFTLFLMSTQAQLENIRPRHLPCAFAALHHARINTFQPLELMGHIQSFIHGHHEIVTKMHTPDVQLSNRLHFQGITLIFYGLWQKIKPQKSGKVFIIQRIQEIKS
jgi:hypothetical protein